MKIQITILAALSASFAMCDYIEEYVTRRNPLPLQAAVCDVVGIGTPVARTEDDLMLQVSQYWFNGIQTNITSVPFPSDSVLPEGVTNFLFFIVKRLSRENGVPIEEVEDPRSRYSYMFGMEEARSQYLPDDPLRLIIGVSSLIPVTTNNADLISWCSNLVYTSQVSPNRQAFYELIRDGYRLNPESSKISRESLNALNFGPYFMPTNFIRQIWSDTNLTGRMRDEVNNAHWMMTRTFLDPDGNIIETP